MRPRIADALGRWLLVLLDVPDSVVARVDAVERGMGTVTERIENLERAFVLAPDYPPEETTR